MTDSVKHLSARHRRDLLIIAGLVILVGCGPPGQTERGFPYVLRQSVAMKGPNIPVNLAGTGDHFWVETQMDDIVIRYADGSILDQTNFGGRIGGDLLPIDVDQDGDAEIAVPLVRNDSLFVSIVDLVNDEAIPTAMVFIARGVDRREITGAIGWEGRLSHVLPVGKPDSLMFVALVATGKAPDGRGAYLINLESPTAMASVLVGGSPVRDRMNETGASVIAERSSGLEQLIFVTGSSANGGVANGVTDEYPYLVGVKIGPPFQLAWANRIGGKWNDPGLLEGNLDGTGRSMFVLALGTGRTPQNLPGSLHLLDPVDGSFRRSHSFESPIEDVALFDFGDNHKEDIAVLLETGEVVVVDREFSELGRVSVGESNLLQRFESGGRELLQVAGNGRSVILSSRLRPVAFHGSDVWIRSWSTPTTVINYSIVRDGLGSADTIIYDLKPQPLWFIFRNRIPLGFAGAALMLLGVGYLTWRIRSTLGDAAAERRHMAMVLFASVETREARALSALTSHFGDPLFDVRAWAEKTGYESPRQLERVVRALTGESPEHVLWLRRVSEAKVQLADSQRPTIAKIAERVGFKSSSHFTRKFKEITGMPPSEWAESNSSRRPR